MSPTPREFEARCRDRLASGDVRAGRLRADTRGNRHLVLLDPGNGVAYRFPYGDADASAINDIATRHRVARSFALPAPLVLDVACGPPGIAFLALEYRRGRALDLPEVQALATAHVASFAASATSLLDGLRAVDPMLWPLPWIHWADLWGELPERLAGFAGELPAPAFAGMMRAAERAALVALDAPLGLIHGDLGGVNVRIDAAGNVTSVLDWDGSVPGDMAVDTAALLSGIPAKCRERILAESAAARDDLNRFAAYQATWAAQGAIWAIDNDRSDVLAEVVHRQLTGDRTPP